MLYTTCWNGNLWGDEALAPEGYTQVKVEGYVFDPAPVRTHDETLRDLRFVLEKISPEDVADAFLYSLSTRQLQYRSEYTNDFTYPVNRWHVWDEVNVVRLCKVLGFSLVELCVVQEYDFM